MRQDIFVTNHNDFYHSDAFGGVVYEFPPKERVLVPVDAAVHMFGFNMPDKSDALSRLGWSWYPDPKTGRVVNDDTEGVKKLAKFVFTKAVTIEERIDSIEPPPPANATERARKKVDFLQTPVSI